MELSPDYFRYKNYRTAGLLLSAALLSIVCCSPRQNTAARVAPPQANEQPCPFETPYRAWFFHPLPGRIAGYPSGGTSALQDAMVRAKGYAKMYVKGALNYYSSGPYTDKQDSITFYYDSTDSESIRGLEPADSFFVCCSKFILLVAPGSAGPADTTNVSGCSGSGLSPALDDPVYLYGKGAYRLRYYDQASSWMAAEELAVKALCRQSALHYASLTKMHDDGSRSELSRTSRYELDLAVKNVTIVSRYYDDAANACVVSAACKKSDIHPWEEP